MKGMTLTALLVLTRLTSPTAVAAGQPSDAKAALDRIEALSADLLKRMEASLPGESPAKRPRQFALTFQGALVHHAVEALAAPSPEGGYGRPAAVDPGHDFRRLGQRQELFALVEERIANPALACTRACDVRFIAHASELIARFQIGLGLRIACALSARFFHRFRTFSATDALGGALSGALPHLLLASLHRRRAATRPEVVELALGAGSRKDEALSAVQGRPWSIRGDL